MNDQLDQELLDAYEAANRYATERTPMEMNDGSDRCMSCGIATDQWAYDRIMRDGTMVPVCQPCELKLQRKSDARKKAKSLADHGGEGMNDERKCPTCKHRHPNSFGLTMCGCEDCFLIWTGIRSQHLAPEKKIRQEELYRAMNEEPV